MLIFVTRKSNSEELATNLKGRDFKGTAAQRAGLAALRHERALLVASQKACRARRDRIVVS